VTGVARGDLKGKLAFEAKGEIAALASTINGMIETLATFADQVTNVAREVGIEGKLGGQAKVPGAAGLWRDLTDNVNQLAANLTTQVRAIAEVSTAVTKGDLDRFITVEASGEVAALKDNINEMIRNLKDQTLKNTEQDWLKTNLARFSRMLQGERDLNTVTNMIMSELAPLVNAQYGLFYVTNREGDEPVLELAASYGAEGPARLAPRLRMREGLLGQCAADKRRLLLNKVPAGYLRIGSGLGEAGPANVIVLPVLFEGDVRAVIELASFNDFSDTHQSFLDQLMESVGIVLNTIAATMRTEGLLEKSQQLTAELQSQQQELTTTNERLEHQATELRKSEEMLKIQQDELRRTNDELQEKALLLSNEKKQVEAKNLEIELARRALEEKAEQLALTSKYKSEFLANMSHELRTPLNSMLILSKLLADNPGGNLGDKQIESARTIHAAGTDLLSLINDILDLSKIESGTVTIEISDMPLLNLRHTMERTFTQIATDKSLGFVIRFDEALPSSIRTDEKRLMQIVLNLLSNAFKFTSNGSVTLDLQIARAGWSPNHPVLKTVDRALAIAVTDTGIGIPREKQKLIFEAFQQADGTTSRKYGGTGLGLSISREIARLLGGEIQVVSTPGTGSTFTLYVPVDTAPPQAIATSTDTPARYINTGADVGPHFGASIEVRDDRDAIRFGDRTVLIIEDDATFAGILLELVREKGMKGVVTTEGAGTLTLAKKFRPDAIMLDLGLTDIDGWAVLDLLKHDVQTRHIPVHVISGFEGLGRAREMGAYAVTAKPTSRAAIGAALDSALTLIERRLKQLLLFADDDKQRRNIAELIAGDDVCIQAVGSAAEGLELLSAGAFDCLVLSLLAPHAIEEAARVIEHFKSGPTAAPPIVIYAEGSGGRPIELYTGFNHGLVLRQAATPGELIDEVAMLLHRPVAALPEERRQAIHRLRQNKPALQGHKVLIIDDDIRNIFSLTSVLEQHKVDVVYAENGRDGIAMLKSVPDIDLALVDIMMPDMDGYETMRAIRSYDALRDLPLIAVTAKAMKGDRQKCIDAGASDYVAKPVDIELLLSLMRVWLERGRTAGDNGKPPAGSAATAAELVNA
jgi:signal transduction histidine kinase/CheY-like chemotaxis protein/HAMP domain-containing protein